MGSEGWENLFYVVAGGCLFCLITGTNIIFAPLGTFLPFATKDDGGSEITPFKACFVGGNATHPTTTCYTDLAIAFTNCIGDETAHDIGLVQAFSILSFVGVLGAWIVFGLLQASSKCDIAVETIFNFETVSGVLMFLFMSAAVIGGWVAFPFMLVVMTKPNHFCLGPNITLKDNLGFSNGPGFGLQVTSAVMSFITITFMCLCRNKRHEYSHKQW